MIDALGHYGDPEIVGQATARFKTFVERPASLPAALRDPVLGIVGHHADQATGNTLKNLGIKATSTEEKRRYFNAMADAADPSLIQQNVTFAGTGKVPNALIPMFIAQAASNSAAPDMVFRLVHAHEDELSKFLPPSDSTGAVLVAAAKCSSNPAIAKDLIADKASSASSGAHIAAMQAADAIGQNSDLRSRAQGALDGWLKQHS